MQHRRMLTAFTNGEKTGDDFSINKKPKKQAPICFKSVMQYSARHAIDVEKQTFQVQKCKICWLA